MKYVLLTIFICILGVGGIVMYTHVHTPAMTKDALSIPVSHTPTQSPAMSTTNSPTPTAEDTCNDLLVLVNKTYGLPATYVPPDLVSLASNGIPVTATALLGRQIMIPDLKNMMQDAKNAGIDLIAVSPYRSFATQQSVHSAYVAQNGSANADTFSAQAGHSQHQLGTAIDFSTTSLSDQLDQSFAQTKAGMWISSNAYKYGFVMSYPQGAESVTGYEYEPWHFRYIGVTNALKLQQSGLNLEVYLQKYGVLPNC